MSYTLQQAPGWWEADRSGLLDKVSVSEEWTANGNDEDDGQPTPQSELASTTSTSSRDMTGGLDSVAPEKADDTSISSQLSSAKDKVDSFGQKVSTIGLIGATLAPVTAPIAATATALTKTASMALGLGEAVAGSFESGWMGDLSNTRENENVKDDLEDYGMSYEDTAKIGKDGEMSAEDAKQNVSDFDSANAQASKDMSTSERVDAALAGFFDSLDGATGDEGGYGEAGTAGDVGGGGYGGDLW